MPDEASDDVPMTLFAFVKRKEAMSREEFLDYWRNSHGPLIRDTPALREPVLRYEQHATAPNDASGFDGVAVQTYRSWDAFIAMLGTPEADLMRADEAAFLDPASIKVVFTADAVVQIAGPEDDG